MQQPVRGHTFQRRRANTPSRLHYRDIDQADTSNNGAAPAVAVYVPQDRACTQMVTMRLQDALRKSPPDKQRTPQLLPAKNKFHGDKECTPKTR
jgi:hypothetical protein